MKSTTQTAATKLANESINSKIERQITRALELKAQIDQLSAEYDAIKVWFKDEVFPSGKYESRLVTGAGAAILKETNNYSIEPTNIPQFKKIFGEIYGDMVTEKVTYSPSAALRKKLPDGDYKHAKFIREAITIKTRYAVEFEEVAINGMKHIKGGKK